jgi:hypothetical protein
MTLGSCKSIRNSCELISLLYESPKDLIWVPHSKSKPISIPNILIYLDLNRPKPSPAATPKCSEFLGSKTNPGNNQGRLKRWLIYHLGVLDKFGYGKHKEISYYFRLWMAIGLWIRDKNAKKLSLSIHAKVIVSHLTLISQAIVWQWVHFNWTKCGAHA